MRRTLILPFLGAALALGAADGPLPADPAEIVLELPGKSVTISYFPLGKPPTLALDLVHETPGMTADALIDRYRCSLAIALGGQGPETNAAGWLDGKAVGKLPLRADPWLGIDGNGMLHFFPIRTLSDTRALAAFADRHRLRQAFPAGLPLMRGGRPDTDWYHHGVNEHFLDDELPRLVLGARGDGAPLLVVFQRRGGMQGLTIKETIYCLEKTGFKNAHLLSADPAGIVGWRSARPLPAGGRELTKRFLALNADALRPGTLFHDQEKLVHHWWLIITPAGDAARTAPVPEKTAAPHH